MIGFGLLDRAHLSGSRPQDDALGHLACSGKRPECNRQRADERRDHFF